MNPTTPTAARADEPTLTFWGAASAVSGSMHLLEAGNTKVLLDCGLYQGRREEARQRNSHFPFHPHQIDAVVVSHAHLGRRGLPLLKEAAPIPPADLLVCESTYGNRLHVPIDATVDRLYATVRETVARGGKVLIPAFSLGRTQLVVHFLQQGLRAGLV